MSGQSFRHPELQNPSIGEDFIGIRDIVDITIIFLNLKQIQYL